LVLCKQCTVYGKNISINVLVNSTLNIIFASLTSKINKPTRIRKRNIYQWSLTCIQKDSLYHSPCHTLYFLLVLLISTLPPSTWSLQFVRKLKKKNMINLNPERSWQDRQKLKEKKIIKQNSNIVYIEKR
jgi:hypothetical protein